jgi:Txe/YoeB family toxin of Txe-Axe toxin-antitoxin module
MQAKAGGLSSKPRSERRLLPQAWVDYQHWQSADRTILKRINRLINEIRRSPYPTRPV